MAHKILGVDLGASALKLVRIDAGFRHVSLLGVHVVEAPHDEPAAEAPAPATAATGAATPAQGPLDAAALRFIARLPQLAKTMLDEKITVDEIALLLPGDLLTFRTIDLPFSDTRRIESVVGYELESQVMSSLDELVIDHVIIGPQGDETRVLVAAAPRAVVSAVCLAASEAKLPLRVLGAQPLAYAALVPSVSRQAGGAPEAGAAEAGAASGGPGALAPAGAARAYGATMLVDVGHELTTVCLLADGKAEMARTIARAGRHFTDAVAKTFSLDPARAQAAKHDAGFLAHEGMAAQSPSQAKMDGCLREAARPLVRELRQTVAAYRASYGADVARLVLTGGGARLVGLAQHLGAELGLEAAPLAWPPAAIGVADPSGALAALGGEPERERLAAAAAAASGSIVAAPSRVNFRKGEFSYRSDFSFLRGKALALGISAAAVLAFAGLNAAMALRGLNQENARLQAKLSSETKQLFGQERTDAVSISEDLKAGAKGAEGPPVPTLTAYDLLDEISRRVPPPDKMKLDLLELDIKPKKTYLKATVETAQQVDDLVAALKKIECFEEVQPGKLLTVPAPAQPPPPEGAAPADKDKKPGPTELKQFTLTINTSCP